MQLKIVNIRNDRIIADSANICSSTWCQAKGLMFALRPGALVFDFKHERKVSLHMFFVFFPIDVLFISQVDGEGEGMFGEVVEVLENFRPFTVHSGRRKCRYVLELPPGTISRTATKVGDRIGIGDEIFS